MDIIKKIAHFGTFDVDNYGDLLFPHIAEYRLPNFRWQHISPTNKKTVFVDAKNILSFREAINSKYDAMITGGGNIIHLLQNNNTVYRKAQGFEYANLWVGASKLASKQRVPHIFNGSGISRSFTQIIPKVIAAITFRNASYLSVREFYSKNLILDILKKSENLEVEIVPDTAFDVAKMWPIEQKFSEKYIIVNLNPRYHNPVKETVYYLEKISLTLNMPIKFVIIGACHGDKDFTAQVAKSLSIPYSIDDSNSLKEIALLIANAQFFLGSSMHGLITALSYNTPAFLVLNKKPMHKFNGLLRMIEMKQSCIQSSFQESFKNLDSPIVLKKHIRIKIEKELNSHWNVIEDKINAGDSTPFNFLIKNYEMLLKINVKKNKLKEKLNR